MNTLELANMPQRDRQAYEDSLRYYHYRKGVLDYAQSEAHAEGLIEGMEKDKAEGLLEGKAVGLAQGREKASVQ